MTARPETNLPLRALGSLPPDWDPDALAAIARRHFDVRGEPHPLGGERDQNLRMLDAHGAPVIVKLSGMEEGRDTLALQTAALRHIARVDPGLNVPRVIASNRDENVVPIGTDKQIGHYLRVLTWLPGEPVEDLGIDSVDAGQVGRYVSRMDALFRDLETYLTEGKDRVTSRFSDAAGVPCGAGRIVIPPPREFDAGKLLERRRKVLGPALHLTYERPLHAVRGDGVWICDENGRPHLDAYNNVPHVGHAHPRVADAVSRQSRLINTNTRYLCDEVVEYAERLTARCPDPLDVCVFVNNGSEATDVAWRIAREWNGHEGALVMEDAYHGCTHATADLSPLRWPTNSGPPHVRCLTAPDTYRGRWPAEEPDAAARFAEDADRKIADLDATGFKLAALVVDTAFCTNGMPDVPEGYLATVAEKVRAAGGLVIADEVQYGFGRPGDRFWGFELHGLVPDLVVLGKPAANGMPLGAVVTRSDVLQRFRDRHHLFSTFGGNPVATAAATAVLDVVEDENLQTNARETGAYLRRGLEALMREHDVIGRVSGQGLFCIVDVVEDRDTKRPHPKLAARLQNAMREEGVLVGTEGRHDNLLKIRPPMPFGPPHADLLIQALERALTVHGRQPAR